MKRVKRKKDKHEELEREEIRGALDDSLRELIDGKLLGEKIIWKNLPWIVAFTLLGMAYIHNRNRMETRQRERVSLIREVEGLRGESLTVSLELMKISSQAEVVRRVEREGLGLEVSRDLPVLIKE